MQNPAILMLMYFVNVAQLVYFHTRNNDAYTTVHLLYKVATLTTVRGMTS